jgi:GTP-binding protein HflX
VAESDLVLHVVDASHPDPEGQITTVRGVVREIDGASELPELLVLNKVDVADPEVVDRLLRREPGALAISARTGVGLDELVARIGAGLPRPREVIEVVLPYRRGDLVSRAHTEGEILSEVHTGEGTALRVRVDPDLAAELLAAAG